MENARFYYMQNYCDFSIARNQFLDNHTFFTDFGFVFPHIGYIEKGSVTFSFGNYSIAASEGDVIFIPAGTPYHSEWCGDPEIDMYVLECDIDFWKRHYVLAQKQYLPELSGFFFNLHRTAADDEPYSAISLFYHIIDKITRTLDFVPSNKIKATQNAISFIENNLSGEFSVRDLSRLCNLSESRFFAVFKKENGFSPVDYKNYMKIKIALQYLKRDRLSVEEICSRLNFSSPAFFRRILKKFTGKTPSQIKNDTLI